ncbi:NAD(P)/FAD-dependent oxidoreductase [Dellaglioa sp. P0083]|uniref:NAD(P)/FAD-dependent oxidoreductase n=1 Tax=Dellaglioa kimchii TaxID=3344667 RepID=UPI0038D4D56A
MTTNEIFDITIIGAGPIGLFTSTYAHMRQAKTQIIESLPEIGGQVGTLYPTKKIYDIAGFTGISGEHLIKELSNQAHQFNFDVKLNETVLHFEKENDIFKIQTSKRVTYSRTIIITAGIGSFQPRKLNIENSAIFENESLFYNISDLSKFSHKKIAIAGGGDSAIDWANELSSITNQIHMIHRRDNFRALEYNVTKLKNTDTIFETPFSIQSLSKKDGHLEILLKHSKNNLNKTIIVDNLLVNYGYLSDNKIINAWGINMDKKLISVNSEMATSIPGVFAAGDIVSYPGKIALIASGFGEAPTAVTGALNFINPKINRTIHSTQLMNPHHKKN